MNLMTWSPIREFEEMFDRYARSLRPTRSGDEAMTVADWSPSVDIHEDEHAFRILAELPGVRKEDVKVQVQDGMLTLAGERQAEAAPENGRAHRVERLYGRFLRRFALPEEVSAEDVSAEYRDGVLELVLPKAAKPEARTIDVEIR